MLSPSQQFVFDQLSNPLNFDKVLITGKAGTGKTWLVGELAKVWHEQGYTMTVCAPTHQAKNVISEKVDHAIINKVTTVASFLGRFKVGRFHKSTFSFPQTPDTFNNGIIVVDECSMLGQQEVEALQGCYAKVVFLGDSAQLPPVKQKKSDVWTMPETFELIDQMRNEGSIESLANLNRETAYYPQYSSSDGSVNVLDTEFELKQAYFRQLQLEPYDTTWLSYTNDEALSMAHQAREYLGHGSQPFVVGEKLRLHTSCYVGCNGESIEVLEVVPTSNNKFWKLNVKGSKTSGHIEVLDPTFFQWKELYLSQLIDRYEDGDESVQPELEYFYETLVEVRYPYSSTIHKSQGSTIKHVFVSSESLRGAAMSYVALSRASETLSLNRRAPKVVRPDNKGLYKELTAAFSKHGLWHARQVAQTTVNSWEGRQRLIEFLMNNPNLRTNEAAIAKHREIYGIAGVRFNA